MSSFIFLITRFSLQLKEGDSGTSGTAGVFYYPFLLSNELLAESKPWVPIYFITNPRLCVRTCA